MAKLKVLRGRTRILLFWTRPLAASSLLLHLAAISLPYKAEVSEQKKSQHDKKTWECFSKSMDSIVEEFGAFGPMPVEEPSPGARRRWKERLGGPATREM